MRWKGGEKMGNLISATDAVNLMQDKELISEVINQVVEDPEIMADLAEDMADDLSDLLEDDPDFKKQLFKAAMGTADFKKRIVNELINEIGD